MNYQQEIQLEEVQSSKFSVQSTYANLRTANDRPGCPDPGCPGKLLPIGEIERGQLRLSHSCASPQNLNAYGKSLRKMNLFDPKKEQQPAKETFKVSKNLEGLKRNSQLLALSSLLLAPGSMPFALSLLRKMNNKKRNRAFLTPLLGRGRGRLLITKQFKTNT